VTLILYNPISTKIVPLVNVALLLDGHSMAQQSTNSTVLLTKNNVIIGADWQMNGHRLMVLCIPVLMITLNSMKSDIEHTL